MHSLLLALALVQDASPHVPLSHWAMPYVEHWIARGVVRDPAPLTRPVTRHQLLAALAAVDTARLGAGDRRLLAAMRSDLSDRERGPAVRLAGHAGVAVASHSRRDALRPAGPAMATAAGGAALELRLGHVTAVTHPYFDTRLRRDPDYRGKKDRAIAGRNAEAYVSAQWHFGELFFGTQDRNWGPTALDGLLLSAAPYAYDHFALALGTSAVRLEGVIAQLDDLPDTAGVLHHRYYVAHRLLVRPRGRTSIALWEGTLVAGPERTLEPWYANIVNLGLLAQYDQASSANNQLGIDVETHLGPLGVFGSVLIDDIQVDRGGAGDDEPTSYGLTLGARGGVGPLAVTGFYTRVSNLTYRTPQRTETIMRSGVGLARNYSDYDQVTVRASLLMAPGLLLTPEATILRQGEGDFRLPYPATADYATTPTFLAGVVERTVRLALGARGDGQRVGVRADAGVHFVDNAGHITGATDTRFVGSIALEYRFTWSRPLP
jgi:hypothetical protein